MAAREQTLERDEVVLHSGLSFREGEPVRATLRRHRDALLELE